jgi:hypothetical protein
MNKRQQQTLERIGACEIQDEKIIKLDGSVKKMIELEKEQIALLEKMRIAYAIEFSKKNWIVVVGDKIFESNHSMSILEYNNFLQANRDEVMVYKTKFKKSQEKDFAEALKKV